MLNILIPGLAAALDKAKIKNPVLYIALIVGLGVGNFFVPGLIPEDAANPAGSINLINIISIAIAGIFSPRTSEQKAAFQARRAERRAEKEARRAEKKQNRIDRKADKG